MRQRGKEKEQPADTDQRSTDTDKQPSTESTKADDKSEQPATKESPSPPQAEPSDTGPAACPLMVVGLLILLGFCGLIISFILPALRYNLGFPL